MAISEDLFMAILSMDSYNRGYNSGIEDGILGGDGQLDGLGRVGSLIGNAEVTADGQDVQGIAQAAGFYAVAYAINDDSVLGLSAGQTVISYRGTDSLNPFSTASDIYSGWPLGGGDYSAVQAQLATSFLAALTTEENKGEIILTGHSLGGGLAARSAASGRACAPERCAA